MSDHLAKEADRLLHDELFNKALDDIRADALNELVKANPDDKSNIIRLQQVAQVTEEIRTVLARYIIGSDRTEQDDASPYA